MMRWHRSPWTPVTLFFLLASQLGLTSLQQCDKYYYHSQVHNKCCHYCEPGFEMTSRCTNARDTQCKPCASGLYQETFNYNFCQPCTQCNVGSGSQVRKDCTPTSDTVCQCTPGTQPVETFKWGVECTQCPPGQFSLGENTMCKLWTNCTAIGKRTLRAGTSKADADCEDTRLPGPSRSPPESTRTTTTSSSTTVRLRVTTQRLGVLSTQQPRPDQPSSPFSVIFLVLLLFLVVGLIMLVLGIYLSKRDKRQLSAIWKSPRTHSFRMPIQEEHQSSLVKV